MMLSIGEAIERYDNAKFLLYLQEEIEKKEKRKEVMNMCTWYDVDKFCDGGFCCLETSCSSLQMALLCNKSEEAISKLMDIGGRQLLMKTGNDEVTVLHYMCKNKSPPVDVISNIFVMGGRGKITEKSPYENLSTRNSVILKMVKIGGRELVMEKTARGDTALHIACWNKKNTSLDIISKLIKVGGMELVMEKSDDGDTALHCVCYNKNSSLDMISKLIDVGGRDLITVKNENGHTALL